MNSNTTLPLIVADRPEQVVAWRHGRPVDASRFLADVDRVAARLPEARHLINLCGERYRFAVIFCAAQLRGQTCLLPPNHAPALIAQLAATHEEAFVVSDSGLSGLQTEVFDYPEFEEPGAGTRAPLDRAAIAPAFASTIPRIEVAHVAARVFTSGSTGIPGAHPKSWGMLVRNAQGAAARLGINASRPCTLLGTVPGQHMYGFESTILLALQNGVAFHGGKPFYPADVVSALAETDGDRVLVTTPFHLRTLLSASLELPPLRLVLCATAPLSAALASTAEAVFGAPLLEIYGCTEAGQVATRRPAIEEDWHAFDGIRIDARDDGWFASGGHIEFDTRLADRLDLHDPTHFRLLGRDNDMVNVAGKRTSIGYLDTLIQSIPGVDDGAFVARDGLPGEVDRLTGFFVSATIDEAEVIAALRRMIDPVFLPRPLHRVTSLPRAATGKLPRATLLAFADRLRAERHREWRDEQHGDRLVEQRDEQCNERRDDGAEAMRESQ